MELFVHGPKTPEKQGELRDLAAKIHADCVMQYVNRLPCSGGLKLRLTDAVIETVMGRTPVSGGRK